MGITLNPEFNKKFPECNLFRDFSDGKDLVHWMDRFDDICASEGVKHFSDFCYPPDEDELLELTADLNEGETIEEPWFGCAHGVRTVNTIIRAFESDKKWSKGIRAYEVRNLLNVLRKLEEVLMIGKKKRAKFYLLCY